MQEPTIRLLPYLRLLNCEILSVFLWTQFLKRKESCTILSMLTSIEKLPAGPQILSYYFFLDLLAKFITREKQLC